MAFCVHCGKPINPNLEFCTHCGQPIQWTAAGPPPIPQIQPPKIPRQTKPPPIPPPIPLVPPPIPPKTSRQVEPPPIPLVPPPIPPPIPLVPPPPPPLTHPMAPRQQQAVRTTLPPKKYASLVQCPYCGSYNTRKTNNGHFTDGLAKAGALTAGVILQMLTGIPGIVGVNLSYRYTWHQFCCHDCHEVFKVQLEATGVVKQIKKY